MITVSKTTIGAVLSGVVGLCFLSYFIFLGRERHSDPVVKLNGLKKRLATKDGETDKLEAPELLFSKKRLDDQVIFINEVNLGEYYLSRGDVALSVKHLTNAMVLCRNPDKLYQVLRNRLPEQVFEMLAKTLPPKQLELWSSSSNLDLASDIE